MNDSPRSRRSAPQVVANSERGPRVEEALVDDLLTGSRFERLAITKYHQAGDDVDGEWAAAYKKLSARPLAGRALLNPYRRGGGYDRARRAFCVRLR
jgi:hypothetical protein